MHSTRTIKLNDRFEVVSFDIGQEETIIVNQTPIYQIEATPSSISLKLVENNQIICGYSKRCHSQNMMKNFDLFREAFLLGTLPNIPEFITSTVELFEKGMMISA